MKLFTKRNLSNGAATRNRYFYIFTVERDVVLDTVSKVSVLGIALYRRKIVADFEIISLLGIKVAKKQINRENLDKLSLSFLINKASEVHPSHSDFISLCGSPSGEIFFSSDY